MLAVDDALGAGATGSGALLGAGALAAVALEAGVLAAGSVVTDGMVVPLVAAVVVPSAGAPVLSGVPAAVSVPGGVSTRVADGSDVVKMEHAARRGIMASTSSTRIEPPLKQTTFTFATGTSRARLETPMQAELRATDRAWGARITREVVTALAETSERGWPRRRSRGPGYRIVAVSAIVVSVAVSLAR
jgi:hypothetical protein